MIVSLGQTRRSLESIFSGISPGVIHEAINYALGTVRVVVTPTGDPWRVSQSMFDRIIDLTLQKLTQLDPISTRTITRAEIGAYIIERGYISSAPPPTYTEPALPVPTVLVSPVSYYSPVIHTIIRRAISPVPTATVSPVPYTPPIQTVVIQPEPSPIGVREPTEIAIADDDNNTILWLVGAVVAGLVLGGMTKERGGRYERTY